MRLPVMRSILRAVLSLGVALAAILPPVGAAHANVLRFGLISVQTAEETGEQWRALLAALSVRLGVAVEPHVSKDYAGVVWAMREGGDAIAWMGNKAGIAAVDNADGEVFARMVFANEQSGYCSLLIVRADSKLTSAAEVLAHAGELTLGLGDPNSTSGYLMPAYHLFGRNGIDPHLAFRRVIPANHETNILGVAAGRIDVATVASNHFDMVVRAHPEVKDAVRVVWRSPIIPSDPMVWRRDLPAAMKEQIRAFFIGYGHPAADKSPAILADERRELARLGMTRFIVSDDRQLLPVRQVELYRSRLAVEADTTIESDERGRRLAAIDRGLVDIERQGAAPPQ